MATIALTRKFLNNSKRTAEAAVISVPAILGTSGSRPDRSVETILAANTYTALAVPENSLIKAIYVQVDEAFDAATTATIVLASDDTALFTTLDVATTGLTKSAETDILTTVKDGIKIDFSADVTQGSLRVIVDYIATENKNGNYV